MVGLAQDVSTKFAITLLLFHASIEATANTNPGKFLVQVSGSGTGNEDWGTLCEFDATISTAGTEAMTDTEPIGETALAVTDTTDFISLDKLYIQNSTIANSEWGLCQEIVTNTSIDLVDGLANEQNPSSIIWNDADIWACRLDLTSDTRLRVIFVHEGSVGANCHIKVLGTTGDNIT